MAKPKSDKIYILDSIEIQGKTVIMTLEVNESKNKPKLINKNIVTSVNKYNFKHKNNK